MNFPRSLLGPALVSTLFVAPATRAQTLGLYSDLGCTSSALTVETGATAAFFVAYSGPEGLVSAEFRIDGLPAGWPVIAVTPNPAATVVIGDPLGSGTIVGFPEARPEIACLNLFTIQVQAATAVADRVLTVTPHRTPWNPQCPSVGGSCSGPCTWQTCAVGGQLVINPSVPVSPGTWSQLKGLYH